MCFDNLIQIDTWKHVDQTNHAEQINCVVMFKPVPICTQSAENVYNADHAKWYNKEFPLLCLDNVRNSVSHFKMDLQMCLQISRLGLRRRGKCGRIRLKSHLDIIRPTKACQQNLIQIKLESHLSDYQPDKHITLALMNMQLIKNKEELVHSILEDNKVDIAVVTEMWLNSSDTDRIWIMASEIGKGDYCLSLCSRTGCRGGGVAPINRKNLESKLLSQGKLSTFQFGKWQVLVKHTCLMIVAVYRPPNLLNIMFLDEITECMVDSLAVDTNVIIAGDFNLHISNENDDDPHNLEDTFAALGLDQHVGLLMHKSGNILDLIFTEGISDLSVISCKPTTIMSDHAVVLC